MLKYNRRNDASNQTTPTRWERAMSQRKYLFATQQQAEQFSRLCELAMCCHACKHIPNGDTIEVMITMDGPTNDDYVAGMKRMAELVVQRDAIDQVWWSNNK